VEYGKCTVLHFVGNNLSNGPIYALDHYRTLIGNHSRRIEWTPTATGSAQNRVRNQSNLAVCGCAARLLRLPVRRFSNKYVNFSSGACRATSTTDESSRCSYTYRCSWVVVSCHIRVAVSPAGATRQHCHRGSRHGDRHDHVTSVDFRFRRQRSLDPTTLRRCHTYNHTTSPPTTV